MTEVQAHDPATKYLGFEEGALGQIHYDHEVGFVGRKAEELRAALTRASIPQDRMDAALRAIAVFDKGEYQVRGNDFLVARFDVTQALAGARSFEARTMCAEVSRVVGQESGEKPWLLTRLSAMERVVGRDVPG